MTGFARPSDPNADLGLRIAEMDRKLREPGVFRIPILGEDPPETDPTNMWMLPDGRLRIRYRNETDTAWVYRSWAPDATDSGGQSSTTPTAPPSPVPVTRTVTWNALWSRSYRESGPARTDYDTRMYYGYSDNTFNGRNRSLIGFDWANVASTLGGGTVQSVTFTMTNIHAWSNSGAEIYFSIHNYSGGSAPASWPGVARSMITHHHFGKPEKRTVAMPLEFATGIRDGWAKGIALEAPSNDHAFYGYAAGFGSGYDIQMTVQYVK